MYSIRRKSLGRPVQLGQLYDARTDSLMSSTLFTQQPVPSALVSSTDTPNTLYSYSVDDSLGQKFQNLNIEGELKASFMGGLFPVQGSGKYLNEEKKSFKSVKGTMVYEVRTKSESISMTNNGIKPLISTRALEVNGATHVVVGINWGAKSIATFEYANDENSKKSFIEGKLAASFKKMGVELSGSANAELDESEQKISNHVSIIYYGDFIAEGRPLPTTTDQVIHLMKEVSLFMKQYNQGRGVALEFELIPISELEKFFGLETKIDRLLVELNEQSIDRVQQELERFLEHKQRFHDAMQEVHSNANLFSDGVLQLLTDKANKIELFETDFRAKLKKLLISIRSGKTDPSELEAFVLSSQNDSSENSHGIDKFLVDNSKIFNKLKQVQDYKQLGIQFLGKRDSLPHFIQSNASKDVYVLVCGDQISAQDSTNYQLNLEFFMQLQREKDTANTIFLIYDVELHAVNNNPETSQAAIIFYSQGRKVDADYRKSMEVWSYIPVAQSDQLECGARALEKTVDVAFMCPNWKNKDRACSIDKLHWFCQKCSGMLVYDMNSKFFCKCGGARFDTFSFKCCDPRHPVGQFLKFDSKELMAYISTLDQHTTSLTTTLNTAKQTIQMLSRPIVDITALVQTNIKIIDDKIKELSHVDANRQMDMTQIKNYQNQLLAKVAALKNEQAEIIKISAQLAHFIKRNSILVFNDELDKFLDQQIQVEEQKNMANPNHSQILQSLRKTKQTYSEQKKIFDDALRNGDASMEVKHSDIQPLIEQLFDLPEYGKKLKEIINAVQHSTAQSTRFQENHYQLTVRPPVEKTPAGSAEKKTFSKYCERFSVQ